MISLLTEHVSAHESYRDTFNETVEYIRRAKLDLQKYGSSQGDKSSSVDKEEKLEKMINEFSDGDNLLRNVSRYSASVINTSNDEGKDTVKQEEHQLRYDWDQVRNQARAQLKTMKKCVEAWNDFEKAESSMKQWMEEIKPKVESVLHSSSSSDLEMQRSLFKDIVKQKYDMESMNDKCEILMEYSYMSEVRERTVSLQSAFTNLYTNMQTNITKSEQGQSDHTDFDKAKSEFINWYEIANGTLQDNANLSGSEEFMRKQMESVKAISSRLTEGQHLLNCASDSLAKILTSADAETIEEIKSNVSDMRKNLDQLGIDVSKTLAALKNSIQGWDLHNSSVEELAAWLEVTEASIFTDQTSNGLLGEMKTSLQRTKYIEEEINKKSDGLKKMMSEASKLAALSGDPSISERTLDLEKRLTALQIKCDSCKNAVEKEIEEYNSYNQNMQETEKWLLQISFQLMAHNSMYITTREMTQQQLDQHEQLLDEIKSYQQTLDSVRALGEKQGLKYQQNSPELSGNISKQHQNVQESYNSLLQTATQIKNRLLDSLEKFGEYEETLQSIFENIEHF